MPALNHAGTHPKHKPHLTWRSSAAAIGLTLGLAVGPLVPPAAAQGVNPLFQPKTPTPIPATAVATRPTAAATPTAQGIPAQITLVDPTPTVQSVSLIQLGTPQTFATGGVPTPAPTVLPTAAPGGLAQSCNDPNRLFGTMYGQCALDVNTQDALQTWAIQSAITLYKLPPTDGPRLMSNARSTLRALVLSRLLTASKKPASQQTPEEQTALATLTTYVQQYKINVAQDALTEYARWQANAFCYSPPAAALAAGSWSCVSPAPTPQQELFEPSPPTYDQFAAWGSAIELNKLGLQPTDQVMSDLGLDLKTAASLAGSGPPVVALGAIAGYNMPRSWFRVSLPYAFRRKFDLARAAKDEGGSGGGEEESTITDAEQAASESSSSASAEADAGEAITDTVASGADTAIETAAATAETADESIALVPLAEGVGASLTAASAGIVLVCFVALVEGSIDLATRTALPDKLNGALSEAQKPVDLSGKDNATTQLIFAQMTQPDPTTIDSGPAANSETDLQINPDVYADGWTSPLTAQSIPYLADDGTFHTARAPHDGWWVDTDAKGASRLTLSIQLRDAANTSWTATRVGAGVLLAKTIDADPSHGTPTTTFNYVDWSKDNWTPGCGCEVLARRARFASSATDAWSVNATAPTTSNSINHFNTTGQVDFATNLTGGASNPLQSQLPPAIKMAVGPNGQPWVVNQQGNLFNRTRGGSGTYVDGQWQSVPGQVSDVAVGGDGSVWAIGGVNDVANIGGSHIYHYNPIPANQATNGWEVVDGGAVAIAVGPDGQPWIVNKQGTIFNRTKGGATGQVWDFAGHPLIAAPSGSYVDGQWQVVPGSASDIAAGVDGSIWIVGGPNDIANIGGSRIYHYNPIPANQATNGWEVIDGGAIAIGLGPDGQPWVVNKQGAVFSRSRGHTSYMDGVWHQVSSNGSATSIAAGGPVF
jgi:hypothetical protein